MRTVTIAVITDLHFAPPGTAVTGTRRYDLAAELLERSISMLNTRIHPDVTLVPGDLLEDGRAAVAADLYRSVASILSACRSPLVVIPGNHDGPAFHEVFRVSPITEAGGLRVVAQVDPPAPVLNARREPEGFERMAEARRGFDGPIVSLQHVPLFPPGASWCPYGYVNAPEVIEAMRAQRIHLAVAGHFHPGFDLLQDGGLWFHATPALAESPHPFDVLRTDGTTVRRERHELEDRP